MEATAIDTRRGAVRATAARLGPRNAEEGREQGNRGDQRRVWEEGIRALEARIAGLLADESAALGRGRFAEALAIGARRRGLLEEQGRIRLRLVTGASLPEGTPRRGPGRSAGRAFARG